jgi:hypothetical protein
MFIVLEIKLIKFKVVNSLTTLVVVCWDSWIFTCWRVKSDPYLILYTKVNSKWLRNLDIRPEPIKLLLENIEENLPNIGLGNDFFAKTSKS